MLPSRRGAIGTLLSVSIGMDKMRGRGGRERDEKGEEGGREGYTLWVVGEQNTQK